MKFMEEDVRLLTDHTRPLTNEFLPGSIDAGESFRLDFKKLFPYVQSKDTDEW